MSRFTNAITHLQKNDPILGAVTLAANPPDLTPHTNYYHSLTSSIIGQQLSVKAARSIKTRFVALFGDHFPNPDEILDKDIEELRSAGLSRAKALYIQDLARHIIDRSVKFDTIDQLTNDEIVRELTKVKGIGEWTVHMFLMFCMGRLDVLPTGDLGIRNGIKQLYHLEQIPSADEVVRIAQENRWYPYQSVASWYIWQSLDNTPTLK